MRNKAISILSVILIGLSLASTALAGGVVKLSDITFSLGWLNASGTLSGLGNTDVTVVLDATGLPS